MRMEEKKTEAVMEKSEEPWTVIIEPAGGNFLQELMELWSYRQLILMFVKRDLKTTYAQTVLGPLWFLLNAILSSSVMTVVFGKIAGISTNGIPGFLFYMAGNILWNDFSGCMSAVSTTFTSNVRLMGKVWFPRMCVPIAAVLSKQIRFFIEFLLFILLYIFYGIYSAQNFVWGRFLLLPFLLVQVMIFALGCGILFTSFTIRYRDLSVILNFILQIWMYATPVVYPASQIPGNLKTIVMLNPMAPVMESFRSILFGGTIPVMYLGISILLTALVFLLGLLVFQRAQRSFLDVV